MVLPDTFPRLSGWPRLQTWLVLFLMACWPMAVAGQDAVPDLGLGGGPSIGVSADYVTWRAEARPDSVSPGRSTIVAFTATITGPGDWKMYALDQALPDRSVGVRPYGIDVSWPDSMDGVTARASLGQDPPRSGYDPTFDMELPYFKSESVVYAVLDVDAELPVAGSEPVVLTPRVQFQICSDEFGVCLRPERTEVPVTFTLVTGGQDAGASTAQIARALDAGTITDGPTPDERPGQSGLLAFLLLAVGAGLASLLTPCVFPMLPLTVSYFTKHADDRVQSVKLAGLYGVSIVATFTVIGIVMAVVVGAAGAQTIASNPWVNLLIAAVLVGFALSLLGLYELRLPSGLVNRVNALGGGSGAMGVWFMGLTLTLVSFSCTAPFVAGLLAAAAGGTWAWPVAGMMVYSATFASPFVLFALFPNALQRLPKSGSWMNVVKVVLGFVELAAAVKFLSNADLVWGWGLISRPLGIAFIVVVFFLAGLYLIGQLRLAHEPAPDGIGAGRLMLGSLFFAVSLYMLPGLFGSPLNALDAFLPPRQAGDVGLFNVLGASGMDAVPGADDGWHVDDIDAAVAEAATRNLPIFVDFTGYTCTNCRSMEANVFPRAPVASRLANDFVRLKLYTDGPEKGDEFHRYQLRLTGIVALPTYAVVDTDGTTLLLREFGMMDVDEFAAFLDKGTRRFQVRS
ncbi:MAG: cytochrome c biogenesis protein CcdA [Rhodothermales bacterium]